MTHRFDQIKPAHHVTKEECQEMIDAAIRKHNRNASIISMCVGWVVLALFAEGLLRLIGVIDPIFPWRSYYYKLRFYKDVFIKIC